MAAETTSESVAAGTGPVRALPGGSDGWRAAAILGAALALFLLVPVLTGGHISHDVAWYLLAARTWLDGAVLYRDIIDVNPPMTVYLATPAAALAKGLGASPHTVFYFYLCAVLGGSLAWSDRVLARCGLSRGGADFLLVFLFLATGVLPIYEFGQREHFLMILSLPYLLHVLFGPPSGRARQALPGAERLLIGMVAGIGFAAKPHFLAVPALVILAQCFGDRSLRPAISGSSIGIGAIMAAYGAAILFLHPDYLNTIVPLAVATYGSFGSSLAPILQPAGLFALAAGIAVSFLARQGAGKLGQPVYFAVLIACGFAVGFLVQGKGWIYHAMPFAMWLGVLIIVRARPDWNEAVPATGRCAAAAVIAGLLWVPLFHFSPQATLKARSDALVAALGPDADGRRIVSWSTSLNAHFPAVTRINGKWSSRFQCLWALPGALALSASSDRMEAEGGRRMLSTIRTLSVDDFLANRPEIVLTPRSIDVPALFMADPRFQPRWARYRKVAELHALEIWIDESLNHSTIGRAAAPPSY